MNEGKGWNRPYFKDRQGKLEVIAHRGGADEVPGETIFAFKHAKEIKADVLEMDVHRTLDGVLVLMHNQTVNETTDQTGYIAWLPIGFIRTLDAGYRWWNAEKKEYTYRGKNIRVPTLEEVFQKFGDDRLVIEIKQAEPSIIEDLGEMIRRFGMTEKVLVASMRHRPLVEFRRRFPEIATSASWFELFKFVTLNFLIPGSYKLPDIDAVQIGIRFGGIPLPFVNKRTVKAARKLDLPIQPWTVNHVDDMKKMIALGVDGIITDKPQTLIDLLKKG